VSDATLPSQPVGGSYFDQVLTVRPRLPLFDGIFHLGPSVLIAAHAPHAHVREHLHDHLYHMHIRYGFEIPRQGLDFIADSGIALQVAMAVSRDHRVDCNPVFVERGEGAEGICLKIGGQDVHWVHDASVSEKATTLFRAAGKALPDNRRFIGFSTSDLTERKIHRYQRNAFKEAVRDGLRADQHFQATWIEPRNEPIVPYEVTICLSDDLTPHHVFFNLPVVVPIGLG
jgi:hypothetical protein